MKIIRSIIKFHKDMMRPHSGTSHKRYIGIMAFYLIPVFGVLDLWFDVPEILYIVLSGLAGLEGALSLADKRYIDTTTYEQEYERDPNKTML